MSLNDLNANPQPTQDTTQPTTTTSSDEPKGSWQDRVNQLTRQARDAERVAGATSEENTELRNQIAQLQTQIAGLASRPAQPDPALFDEQPRKKAGSQTFDLDGVTEAIKGAVLEEIKPITEQLRANQENAQLVARHRDSFKAAVQSYPELRDQNSEHYQAFQQLWDGSPDMYAVDRAPELLATAARGLLSDARRTSDVRKIAAAANKPTATRQDDITAGKDLKEAKQAFDQLVTDNKAGKTNFDGDEMTNYLKLAVATKLTPEE